MECPKCHKNIGENETVCPYCHKVLALQCPNCGKVSATPTCEHCGYIILTKCSKCAKIVPTSKDKCRCGFYTNLSLAYQECETDEFASLVIKFDSLKNIRKQLGSQELFTKFYYRLRNLLTSQLKGIEGCIVTYNDTYVVNFNKELSLQTSSNKAARLSIKLLNAFCSLNSKVIEELGVSLKMNLAIIKKSAEALLEKPSVEGDVKLLNIKKNEKKYLKGMQITLDQFVWDCVNKDYKTDSLYSVEQNGMSVMFYEILIENYVLPPEEHLDELAPVVQAQKIEKKVEAPKNDKYAFKVFDINAKCKFKKVDTESLISILEDNKIISIRSAKNLQIQTSLLQEYFEAKGLKVVRAVCTEEKNYKPWALFEQIFRDYYNLSEHISLIDTNYDYKRFKDIFNLILNKPRKAGTPEDARFAYMEDIGDFLASLKNTVIIIEGFESIDDTSLQTLELYFDRFQRLNSNFVFVTETECSLHSKIKGLLRTPLYTEYTLQKTNIETLIDSLKCEASNFIESFYYEKIKENFDGSYLYFENAIKYLMEKGILLNFENRLIIKSKNSIILPVTLTDLLKARLKNFSKNMDASLILAYSVYLGFRLDFALLEKLGVKDVIKNVKILEKAGFLKINNQTAYINNYDVLKLALEESLKPEVQNYICKTILANAGKGLDNTTTLLIMGKLSLFKEEYLLLWKNSQFAMSVGDYDAYLKNCLGFLSLLDYIGDNIPAEDIENNKKEVFQNILMSLYNYSPAKIYSIENVLLMDAINENDNEKIVKLSNLMLQGALISSNYTDALSLLHNIFTRMQNPMLVVEGSVNTKFLLLSLVHIEILYNIGDYAQCVEVGRDLLSVLKPEILDKIKPAGFSINLFVEHLLETLRLVALSKLVLVEDDLDEFFDAVCAALNTDLPEKDCIIAIRDFLAGKSYAISNIEGATAYSKVVYLILREFSEHKTDYKTFAQNIYQAKLLAADIHQTQLELFCDLLIAASYANMGIKEKAELIYADIVEKAETSAIFNIIVLAKYFIARLRLDENQVEEALLIINNTLALLQKFNNQAVCFVALFEQLLVDTVREYEISEIDIESDIQKLAQMNNKNRLVCLVH